MQATLTAMLEEGDPRVDVMRSLQLLLARSLGCAGRIQESPMMNVALLRDDPRYGPQSMGARCDCVSWAGSSKRRLRSVRAGASCRMRYSGWAWRW
ncbi:MAG: hypothetical protein NTW56_00280 [Alphaproteobacteria bacterium]|nr:hypothetical protein [Alphaproteobacteria bacterium]